jgi:hypothetical protein
VNIHQKQELNNLVLEFTAVAVMFANKLLAVSVFFTATAVVAMLADKMASIALSLLAFTVIAETALMSLLAVKILLESAVKVDATVKLLDVSVTFIAVALIDALTSMTTNPSPTRAAADN